MGEGEILGTTTISNRWRISLIKAVRDELAAENGSIEIGDRVVYRVEDGKITIEPT